MKETDHRRNLSTGDQPLLIYVVGYGHSGSTIFDVALRNHDLVVGCGELTHLTGRFVTTLGRCGCRRMDECPFFSDLLDEWLEALQLRREQYERWRAMYETRIGVVRLTVAGLMGSRHARGYLKATAALYELISEKSGKPVIVDSSKSAGRALAVSKLKGVECVIVHLIRDPRRIAWSMQRREQRPSYRTALLWFVQNSVTELVRFLTKARWLRVRYEDFMREPNKVLSELADVSGLDLTVVIDAITEGRALQVGCSVDGNHIRKSSEVVVNPELLRQELPAEASTGTVTLLTLPLLYRYGYLR
jgi:hypothetical protein